MKFAKKFGATHIFNTKNNDLHKYVNTITSNHGVDYTFDMVGNEKTQNLSIKITKSVTGFNMGGKFFYWFPKKLFKFRHQKYINGSKNYNRLKRGSV